MPTGVVTAYGSAPLGQGPGMSASGGINAEDVLDLIVDVTPWETPVVTILPKVEANSTRHEWITDFLGTAQSRHGITEGADFGADATTLQTKTRRANFLQHFRYEIKVSNLQRLMNPYGIADQYSYEVGKLTKQIGKDIEARLLEDTFVQSGAVATYQGLEALAGARMKTLIELIAEVDTNAIANGVKSNIRDSTNLTGLTAASGLWDGTNPTISAQARLTENMVNKFLELLNGGGGGGGVGSGDSGGAHPDTIVVGPASYGHVGAFGGAGSGAYPFPATQPPLTNAKLSRVVRFYDSQFGLIEVINSRWCPQAINTGAATTFVRGANPGTQEATTRNDGFAYFFERNRLRLAFARGVQHIAIPPAGDAARGMVVADVTTELLSSRSAGVLVAVNNV